MNWKRKLIIIAGILVLAGWGYVQNSQAEAAVTEDVKPRIALTFDDGPHPVYTPKLLDGLKKRDVKASFFVIGKNMVGNEAIIKRMSDEGHLIGNHTYDHVRITTLDEASACEQMIKTNEKVKEITGKQTEYIRPPFGAWNPQLECGLTMFPVMWTVDPLDWTTGNVDQVVNKVIKDTEENDIILLHDYYDSSVDAALRIIDLLQAQGFEFVTVDQLILE